MSPLPSAHSTVYVGSGEARAAPTIHPVRTVRSGKWTSTVVLNGNWSSATFCPVIHFPLSLANLIFSSAFMSLHCGRKSAAKLWRRLGLRVVAGQASSGTFERWESAPPRRQGRQGFDKLPLGVLGVLAVNSVARSEDEDDDENEDDGDGLKRRECCVHRMKTVVHCIRRRDTPPSTRKLWRAQHRCAVAHAEFSKHWKREPVFFQGLEEVTVYSAAQSEDDDENEDDGDGLKRRECCVHRMKTVRALYPAA